MTITHIESGPRMSQAVIHNGTVYLSGQVGAPGESATEQTRAIVRSIDNLLLRSGSSKRHLLSAIIWLADISDFGAMNAVWDEWMEGITPPARATGESRLATPDYKVEIIVTAAVAETTSDKGSNS